MGNEIIVREYPVDIKRHSDGSSELKGDSDNIINVKHKVIRESRFNKDKAKRIPKHVGRLAKEAGKVIWGYTVGHESNTKGPRSGGQITSKNNDQHTFHPDDVVARRSSQNTGSTGNFWASNTVGGKRIVSDKSIGQSFNWSLQSSPSTIKTTSRYTKRYRGGKTWKKRR